MYCWDNEDLAWTNALWIDVVLVLDKLVWGHSAPKQAELLSNRSKGVTFLYCVTASCRHTCFEGGLPLSWRTNLYLDL